MDHLTKALAAFVAISMSLISISLPEDGEVIKKISNDVNQNLYYEYTSSFYKTDWDTKIVMDPVVKINFEVLTLQGPELISSGTGFSVLYDKNIGKSYILTNAHICKIQTKFTLPSRFYYENKSSIMSPTSTFESGGLNIIGVDESKDLCLMESDFYVLPAKIAKKDYKVRQMEKVKIIGAPNGVFPIVLDSYISNLISRELIGAKITDRPLYLLSSIIHAGQSGSPVYNESGEVVGVVFINLNNNNGPIYGAAAIPLEDVREFLTLYRIL